jgi:hypothetical protein
VSITSKKVPKGKKQAKVGPSQKSNNPTTNTRKATKHAKETRGSTTVRKPRQKNIIPEPSTQEKDRA